MVVSSPIADMLTRIRNANQLRYAEVSMPLSKMKEQIASILKAEGYISDYSKNGAEQIVMIENIMGTDMFLEFFTHAE